MLLAELERGDANAAGRVMALQFDEAIVALVTDTHRTECIRIDHVHDGRTRRR